MKYRWTMRPVENREALVRLQHELNRLPEPLARALVLRGIETFDQARLFFRSTSADLHDPFLMKDMHLAAARVARARERGECVLVYGDYDVDGTTSTALMTGFLRELGIQVDYFVPDRIENGYGLGKVGIDKALEIGAGLIIALDCGITAHDAAQYARQQGVDLIICDHHTPEETYPDAVAVLNPKRADCPYPFKELSGCGVGFKLLQAVLAEMGEDPARAYQYLDLVAVSIASDIVPLYGENRILMRAGLEVLRSDPRMGLRKLAEMARVDLTTATTHHIVFGIGPRINAAGRMGDANRAVALLLEEDEAEATRLVFQLEQANIRRRTLDQETAAEAQTLAERHLEEHPHSIVLYGPDWHPGVIGIVASRLVERYYLPVIMLCRSNGIIKGSARSINGVSVYDALQACADVLTGFGGHTHAAGVSLREENLALFQRRFDEAVRTMVTPELLLPEIEIDAGLELDAIDRRFWNVLKQFEPHGPHNSLPVFQARNLEILGNARTVGKSGEHVKFAVRQIGSSDGRVMEVIGFGMQESMPLLQESRRDGKPIELLFNIQENTWKGTTSLQIRAKDLRLQGAE